MQNRHCVLFGVAGLRSIPGGRTRRACRARRSAGVADRARGKSRRDREIRRRGAAGVSRKDYGDAPGNSDRRKGGDAAERHIHRHRRTGTRRRRLPSEDGGRQSAHNRRKARGSLRRLRRSRAIRGVQVVRILALRDASKRPRGGARRARHRPETGVPDAPGVLVRRQQKPRLCLGHLLHDAGGKGRDRDHDGQCPRA